MIQCGHLLETANLNVLERWESSGCGTIPVIFITPQYLSGERKAL